MAEQAGSRREVEAGERAPGWGLAAALALCAAALWLAVFQGGPPPAGRESAPPAEFSAGRAGTVLRDLLGNGPPHPVGSPAAAAVRERIVAHLRALGYTPEVQEAVACN